MAELKEMEEVGEMEEIGSKPEIISGSSRRTASIDGISKQNWIRGSGSIDENPENYVKSSRKAAWNNYFKFKIYVEKTEEGEGNE